MAFSSAFFTRSGKKKRPTAVTMFRVAELTDLELLEGLLNVAGDISKIGKSCGRFQRKNARSLVRKTRILLGLFESATPDRLSSPARLCFNEIRIHLDRSRDLLDYCARASRIWLLLKNSLIAGHFLELDQEISALLGVLPIGDLSISGDVQEQIELLQRQASRSILCLDPEEETLRLQIGAFLDDFENARTPDLSRLRDFFHHGLQIKDGELCKREIEAMERQICEEEEEPADLGLLQSASALARYARFALFPDDVEPSPPSSSSSSGVVPPEDLCCPISLELMRDPVVVCTGQTYDRTSIERWIGDGHGTCPKSSQPLRHVGLVPNRAVRGLIAGWCAANGAAADSPEPASPPAADITARAAVEANRATAGLLVERLRRGGAAAKAAAAMELRLLAKNGSENRAAIAEAGALPLLQPLLFSSDGATQENAVTAVLNLSIREENKVMIMAQAGLLRAVVGVLLRGRTAAARENAAATLFSLSVVDEHKPRICGEAGAVEALAGLLSAGSRRGKKDAAAALFNLSTRADCCEGILRAGAAAAMVAALEDDAVAEEAAGALAVLLRQPAAAEAVAGDGGAVAALAGLMGRGSDRARENSAAALLEICRGGAAEKVAQAPAMAALLQRLHATGTKRARRKAAALTRLCYRRRPGPSPDSLSLSSSSSIFVPVL